MRCFLGITLPADCRAALREAWKIPTNERTFLKLTDPGQWHVTLAFFGEIEYANLIQISELIGHALETPPEGSFRIPLIKTFPPKKPSYYVAMCQPEQLDAWRECVSRIIDLTSLIAPQIDRKPWIPHITLARTRHSKLLEPFETSIDNIGWVPEQATLFRSELTAKGPIYTPLHDYRLNF